MTKCVHMCVFQPRGRTFPMLEGPNNQESSMEDDQECVITPSTTVKFSAALKERNRINFMRNSLLLIGTAYCTLKYLQSELWESCKYEPLLPTSGDILIAVVKCLHSIPSFKTPKQVLVIKSQRAFLEKCGIVESCELRVICLLKI